MSDEDAASLVAATEIIRRLRSHGHAAYICGGWVRDRFMQRSSPDIDIATSASSMQVQKLFRNVRVLPRNTVRVPVMNEVFEVTTFRGYQRDSDLTSVRLDAEARDFTMNALYYDPLGGEVLDFVGGVQDIHGRVLAGCGSPTDRLREDPVRVLRAVRFVVAFRFRLEPNTANALKQVAPLCCPEQGTSGPRLWREFIKMAHNDEEVPGSFIRGLRLAFQLGLLQHLLPFIANDAALQQALEAQQRLPSGLPVELRIAALLPPSSKLSDYVQLSTRFKVGETEASRIDLLARLADLSKQQAPDPQAWVNFYGSPQSQECLDVMLAWLPEVWRAPFQQFHQEKQQALNPDIQVIRAFHQRRLAAEQGATQWRPRTGGKGGREKTLGELLPAHVLEAAQQGFGTSLRAQGMEPTTTLGSPLVPSGTSQVTQAPVPWNMGASPSTATELPAAAAEPPEAHDTEPADHVPTTSSSSNSDSTATTMSVGQQQHHPWDDEEAGPKGGVDGRDRWAQQPWTPPGHSSASGLEEANLGASQWLSRIPPDNAGATGGTFGGEGKGIDETGGLQHPSGEQEGAVPGGSPSSHHPNRRKVLEADS